MGEHRVDCHGGAMVQLAVTILARESDVSARKTQKAFWIASRNPKISCRDECVAVTHELAPFVGLLRVDLQGHALEGPEDSDEGETAET
ncbi:unnamed protein product [Heligmosomoides polygyrus]|uniref:Mg_chelatase_C domain-containing protein n=1 Tax=Heligmosomoides polygyrus TaxID=6339 RepID=A0A183FGX6_HELPZ|nr:unnamed protein product [Heligmosomoides polygyrus]